MGCVEEDHIELRRAGMYIKVRENIKKTIMTLCDMDQGTEILCK